MRLFIADDSEILREHLVEILSEIEGVDIVGEEGDATKVLESIGSLEPDLVILDIQFPEGNGILVLEAIKNRVNPPIIVMFTNYPYLQYRKRCLDAGADHFFYKATEFENLIELLKEKVELSKK